MNHYGHTAGDEPPRRQRANMKREIAKLIGWALDNGLPVAKTRNGHWRIETPAGPVFMPSTPSDHRSVKNARALLRRMLKTAGWPKDRLP